MPLLGTPFSIDRLLGLHLFDSAFGPAQPPSNAANTAKQHPATTSAASRFASSASSPNVFKTGASSSSASSALALLGLVAKDSDPAPSPSPPAAVASPSVHIAAWPMAQLPVEIFEIITRYLTRADVQALRLVCREFEAKVSAQYFRNVVVPFRAELYTSLDDENNAAITSRLFSNGMRIFESFGPHILRFALSLELDEFILAYPPVKPAQEAIPAFWGIYRWPHETYHRYRDLEGLEQTADETDSMKKALRCLTKVTNIGLCCDAGLGFLVGPEHAVHKINNRDPVFDARDWHQDSRVKKGDTLVAVSDFNGVRRDLTSATAQHDNFKRRVLEKMISDAGFAGYYVHEAIDLLLETEGVTISEIDFDEREVNVDEQQQQLQQQQQEARISPATRQPLIPTNLTRAQKELLLELEWAHRAMIQSYVISIIDNARDGCFTNLTNVTIAKIPSAHIHILCHKELWENIPSIKTVSLAVIADWRKISKPSPGVVEDVHVSPVDAVGKVYRLLNDHIGRRPNIESLRFEWICGGEFARGPYQRNQYVLPAPFVESPDLMISPEGAKDTSRLLHLPFIKYLSLKNCWFAPHVLFQTTRYMALHSLEKLDLETVSISGPPTIPPQQPANPAPPAADDAGVPLHPLFPGVIGPVPVALFQQPAIPPVPEEPSVDRLALPDTFSWAGFCEHFSPGIKMRHLPRFCESSSSDTDGSSSKAEDLSPFLPDASKLKVDESRYGLSSISFKSCGYVFIDVRTLDIRAILPTEAQLGHAFANALRHDIFHSMQYSKDKFLGRIVPYMLPAEMKTLEHIFLFEQGWSKVYPEQVLDDAVTDGFDCPGMARFSGTLEGPGDAESLMMTE
ncbi:hypothetical protein M441DRAFT_203823 [Trichoderma asperellum CBS 433.97]|uniref:F-box domain-containing protein n=1 Tax=Trichoderma asperellum (strain ATCC 204424 / CBS 433.97 / NBRC 101777) TaxID=1042311 RepID=A0A2T3YU33_TRIA4|nr:hypothetical protein M441DRAFT_203823 [Trichoderma asperellum CBS 433.97]PTB36024.1 hypothetical protein M441DRAFT_203823 [Trichoderma asperellum CBS 433.97]